MDYVLYFVEQHVRIITATWEHILLTVAAVGAAVLCAIPAGILLSRHKQSQKPVFAVVNTIQTVPSLALLGFMIPLLGLGDTPAVVALFLYALLPILRNTVIGMDGVDKGMLEAATGMGMTRWQILWRVELPLAMPTILAGIRIATIVIIGWATLAAYVGGSGLGRLIVAGLATARLKLVVAGAVPAVILALGANYLLSCIERRLRVSRA
ncbi:ABC transporter permease [Acetonema longum]|uniref:Glycine betaine/L-proline ABC transporter, permease protein n=1 Tax=Acetonema longum DSM 6540 TaxID=1009370 RepID=F7NEG6_9FIRM|nr:ABC transporter permease [Acetonema longum]EGO65377.1 glycine betaine/L-proline ABC transporter, permease protein [Acetonema longum DSM 6540]